METETYQYTLQYSWFGIESEEDCSIRKDIFYPFGAVGTGLKIRGEFGFIEIIKVFDTLSLRYGKFIARSITYEEMNN